MRNQNASPDIGDNTAAVLTVGVVFAFTAWLVSKALSLLPPEPAAPAVGLKVIEVRLVEAMAFLQPTK